MYFQAETDSPIFVPLSELVTQTLVVNASLKEALQPLAGKINYVFIYGSVARKEDHILSDIDLMVIGQAGLSELSSILRVLENKFNREIDVTCYSLGEFAKKVRDGNHFLTNILKKEKIF
ncbi:MAG: nucleotidyltransferase domain-containing protein [Pyrinomonadaceae bacterium]